eukprot:Phypoly_transcript_13344.p1 GENE.Phypoly_transcript_13344~~Phypoly_transcript_13344.p1  ORF type:complete len:325 (+),score=41.10 Phypoly_transcript_13344:95-1069(+)
MEANKQEEGKFNRRIKDILAGGLSGGVTRFIIAPLDVIKIRFQVQVSSSAPKYRTVSQAIRVIVKEEGVRALWKGNLTAEYLWIAFAAAQFATYHATVDLLPDASASKEKSVLHYLAGGSVAGIASTIMTYPLDLVRTRLAAQGEPKIYKSLGDCFASTVRRKGIQSLWSGVLPTVVQIIPSMAIQFTAYELLNKTYNNYCHSRETTANKRGENETTVHHKPTNEAPPLAQLSFGALAGVAAKLGVMPLDTIKKRMQMSGVARDVRYGEMLEYKNTFHCIATIAKREGIRGFYKGTVPSLYKAAPSAALTFMFYEQFKKFLNQF